MNSLRISVRRAGSVFAALALVLSTALPGIVSAAQVTERSIALSTSAANADGVTYNVKFTAVQAADAFLIDFCSDSPLIGATCTQPTGMVVTGAGSVSSGVTDVTGTGHQIVVTKPITAAEDVDVVITGIDNPTAAGNLYARILTFDTANLGNYTSDDPDNAGANPYNDDGGVAMYITPTIAVSGAVLESMLFCVTGTAAPGANCDLTGTTTPTLALGEDTGGVVALSSGALSEGTIYTQLSTNAASGAVVSLKSNTTSCGGLSRQGAADFAAGCAIVPANATNGFGIAANQAKFGVRLGTAAGVGTSDGTYQIYGTGGSPYYENATFKLNAFTDNSAGVTSTYGDPLLDTANAPLNNMNMPVIFGASATNSTPAGNYQANLSLIATGKF